MSVVSNVGESDFDFPYNPMSIGNIMVSSLIHPRAVRQSQRQSEGQGSPPGKGFSGIVRWGALSAYTHSLQHIHTDRVYLLRGLCVYAEGSVCIC